MLRFPNTLGVIFGARMNTVRSSGFSRSATGPDNLPTKPPEGGTPNELSRVLLIKPKHCKCVEFPFMFISSEALQRNAKPRQRGDFRHPKDGLYAAKDETRLSNISVPSPCAAIAPKRDLRFFSRDRGIRMTSLTMPSS